MTHDVLVNIQKHFRAVEITLKPKLNSKLDSALFDFQYYSFSVDLINE